MKLFEEINLLQRLDQFIRLKATGTPCELGEKLGISKRQVYRYIDDMKEMGLNIAYCKQRNSYFYKEDTFLKFKMSIIKNGEENKIIGGQNNSTLYESFFQSDKKWHSDDSPLYQVDEQRRKRSMLAPFFDALFGY